MDSILTSIKKQLGITEDYEAFDPEIIIHINTVFSILNQLGVGPETPFTIEDKTATWDQFIGGDTRIEMVKTYIYLRVRLIFDPPTNSFVVDAFKKQYEELEVRMNLADDPVNAYEGGSWTDPDLEEE